MHCLLAVGGFGRQEMFPHSDIDLVIIVADDADSSVQEKFVLFSNFLWDIGLKPGLSIRTVEQSAQAAEADQTIMTNLMENRLIIGSIGLYQQFNQGISPSMLWPSDRFFAAKLLEQERRHQKYHDTAYNLEPNIKEGPGGLRDLHVINWVFKRHHPSANLKQLINYGYLQRSEYVQLISGISVLWRIRYALHLLTNRGEDRLLFEYQRDLAKQFGFGNGQFQNNEDVEQFMQFYFKTILKLQRLNEILLQLFSESFMVKNSDLAPIPYNDQFVIINGYLEARNNEIFERQPLALLEIFLILAKNSALKGVRTATIRLIRKNLHLIDDDFRSNKRANQLFIDIFRQPQGVTHQLRNMNRYGVLAAYLPHFANIVARMQYDLFHIYTVDTHTLFVIRNLRRFSLDKHRDEMPFCNEIFVFIHKPEILYIAALFHDIAKGLDGDHSIIGEQLVTAFCRQHDFSSHDRRLTAWLVSNHLIMSTTAQHKDISAPDVILEFAHKVGSIEYLNHLYILTIADIRATNPELWNSWKDALLKELYSATRNALRRGLQNPISLDSRIHENKKEALEELLGLGFHQEDLGRIWRNASADYFLRYSVDEIIWQVSAILSAQESDLPLVLFRSQTRLGNADIFIFAKNKHNLFSICTATLDQLGLSILDARIMTTFDNYVLDTFNTFQVLEQSGEPVNDSYRIEHICSALRQNLLNDQIKNQVNIQRLSRQAKYFPIPTEIQFQFDATNNQTILELTTTDRQGLLAQIGQIFDQHNIQLHNARITTIGSRVEDIFYITDSTLQPISDPIKQEALRKDLINVLDNPPL